MISIPTLIFGTVMLFAGGYGLILMAKDLKRYGPGQVIVTFIFALGSFTFWLAFALGHESVILITQLLQ